MELRAVDAAELAGVTQQQVSNAVQSGALSPIRRVGRTALFDDLGVIAWSRARARGRRWTERVRNAALDLASTSTTKHLAGPELARLRRILRKIDARTFAHYAGALGGRWTRFADPELGAQLPRVGPSAIDPEELGIVSGTGKTLFVSTDSLDRFTNEQLPTVDADGELGVIERIHDDRHSRVLLDTYLLGSSRESRAAAEALETACHVL